MADVIDEQAGSRLFAQLIELWISPEIRRRQSAGRLPSPYELRGAQIVFRLEDGGTSEIRLNQEVKGKLEARIRRTVEVGEPVTEADIDQPRWIEPIGDPNAAHLTLLRLRGKYWIFFDFRYNKELAGAHLDRAAEFLAAAEADYGNGRLNACVESLWSGVDLCAKAFLMTLPDPETLRSKKHSYIKRRFNAVGRFNFPEYPKLLNRLEKLREAARYLEGDTGVDGRLLGQHIKTAREFHTYLRNYVAQNPYVGWEGGRAHA